MFKQAIGSVLIAAISFSAMAKDAPPVSDFKMIVSEDCKLINPKVIDYLRDSDYIQKKTRSLELSIQYNQEIEDVFKDLRDDAAKTALASRVLLSASVLLLARTVPLATTGTGGIVTQAVDGVVSIPTNIISAAANVSGTLRVGAGLVVLPVSGMVVVGAAYLTFIEPLVSGYEYSLRNAESQKEAARIFANIGNDFKKAHKSLDDQRAAVDLNYTALQNGLSLGGKAKDATEKLYAISVAKTILFQAELDLVKKLEDKVETCR